LLVTNVINKTINVVLSCLLILTIVTIFSTDSLAESDKSWKIGHVRSSGSAIDKDVHKLIERINTETKGDISFNVYPNNRLGDYSVVQERVSFGEVEMYVGPFSTTIDKKLMVAFTPFLVSNWSDAQKIYSHGSEMMDTMEELLELQNIKVLGGWPVYFGGIALTEKPLSPGNPDISKDLIIRVPPIKSFELTAKALGFTPYPITWMYARMGLKTGLVSGIIGGGAEGYAGLGEHIKYYMPIKDHFEYWFIYMNLDLWKNLPQNHQKVLSKSVINMETERYAIAEEEEKKSLEQLKNQGIEIINLTEKELSAMKAKVRKEVWPLLQKESGITFPLLNSNYTPLQRDHSLELTNYLKTITENRTASSVY
jgi:TRAP-type C4-dicarboxylate transport system substrate-binding protein